MSCDICLPALACCARRGEGLTVLRLENLAVRLENFRFGPINLHVSKGEYRVVLGTTGTGKTVLLETIAGLHKPCAGRIFLRQRDITDLAPEKRNLGIVYQDYALFPHMTVEENIAFGLRMRRADPRRIAEDVLQMADFLNLRHLLKRTPGRLSGGERQRTALARALVMKPYMLLLDEPLSALDRLTRDRLKNELKRIHTDMGITVLHITHDLSEAFLLADTLAVMKDGRILQEGPPEQVLARPHNRMVAELVGIRNFIPAHADDSGMVSMKGLGNMPAENFSPVIDKTHGSVLISVPDWAVMFSSGKPSNRPVSPLLYEGKALLKFIHYSGSHIEAVLELPGGNDIRATLSRRELAHLEPLPIQGSTVWCRIEMKGIHWMPAGWEGSQFRMPGMEKA